MNKKMNNIHEKLKTKKICNICEKLNINGINNIYGNLVKYVSVIIIATILVTLFVGCAVSVNEKEKNTEKQTTANGSSSVNSTTNDSSTIHKEENKSVKENSENSSKSAQQEVIYPITVKDTTGTEVTIEKKPVKIVSVALVADEILPSLVDKSRIAALSYLSEDPGLSNVVEFAKGIPVKVGMQIENLIALQPDLLLLSDFADPNAVSQLRDANIPVYVMKTPTSVEEARSAVLEIANLVGEIQKGEEVVAWMDEKLKAVEEKVKNLSNEERVRVLTIDAFLYTYGKGTSFDSIAQHAGVINLASEVGMEFWQEINKEVIIELNPDVLLLPSWSFEGFDAEKYTEDFKNDKSLAEVKAIKNNKVFNLPDNHMVTVSQYIVLGVEDLAKTAYPELFK
ncbi:MAG TPA: ABC transporter substrate-binding protein [Clostridiaceae bacterium]|nr:ABC transporter substrate-binding protein [Clostridiaceae bacterium]